MFIYIYVYVCTCVDIHKKIYWHTNFVINFVPCRERGKKKKSLRSPCWNVQTQSSIRRNTLLCQEPLYFLVYKNACNCWIFWCFNVIILQLLGWVWKSLFIGLMGLTKLVLKLIWLIRSIILMQWVLQV